MAQKTFLKLHRVNKSMYWESSIYNKKYKYYSYTVWLILIYFYKNIIKIDDYNFMNFLEKKNILIEDKRLIYNLNLYFLQTDNLNLVINLYSKIEIKFFKKKW